MSSLFSIDCPDILHYVTLFLSDAEYKQIHDSLYHHHQKYQVKTAWTGHDYRETLSHVIVSKWNVSNLTNFGTNYDLAAIQELNLFYDGSWSLFWPPRLKRLTLNMKLVVPGTRFEPNMDHCPDSLISLTLKGEFNAKLDHLPTSLLHLKINNGFNQNLDYLPDSLLTLKLGAWFIRPLDHLPSQLQSLTCYKLKTSTLDHLPPSLKYLKLDHCSWCRLDWLPFGLESLQLSFNPERAMLLPLDYLPLSLKQLDVNIGDLDYLDHLPAGLQELNVHDLGHGLDYLPSQLQKLSVTNLRRFTEYNMDHLPPTLKEFYFDSRWHGQNWDHLPSQLIKLTINARRFDQPLDYLPSNLQCLVLRGTHLNPLCHLPPQLHTLTLDRMRPEIEHILPSLTELQLNSLNSPIKCYGWCGLCGQSITNSLPQWPPLLKVLHIPNIGCMSSTFLMRQPDYKVEFITTDRWLPFINHQTFPHLQVLQINGGLKWSDIVTYMPHVNIISSYESIEGAFTTPWPLNLMNLSILELRIVIDSNISNDKTLKLNQYMKMLPIMIKSYLPKVSYRPYQELHFS
jgi:hypothetical protein